MRFLAVLRYVTFLVAIETFPEGKAVTEGLTWHLKVAIRLCYFTKSDHLEALLSCLSGLQLFTGYLRLTLVFMGNGAQGERFNCYFSRVFC